MASSVPDVVAGDYGRDLSAEWGYNRIMKFYHIVPPTYMDAVLHHQVKHMMVLGQHLISDKYYRENVRLLSHEGVHVMVDNGAAELSQPDFTEIARVAHYVDASEVVMPDTLYDAPTTIRNILSLKSRMLVPPKMRVVIPQGRTLEEWLSCYWTLRSALSFAVLGIPKHLEQHAGGRAWALEKVIHDPSHAVHMFGIWKNPRVEIDLALKAGGGRVRSIDSGAAVAYAQSGVAIDSAEHASLDWYETPHNGRIHQAVLNMHQLEVWSGHEDSII